MMVIGIDPHKQSHTAVAADELGRKKAQKTVRARREGHRELIAWAREIAPAGRLRAVEAVRHVAGGLIRELLAAGEQVVFVPPKLMAGERRGGRERGKSDPIDARCPSWPASRPCPPRSRAWRRTWPAWSPPWSRNCWPSRASP